ncbi:MAG TPA: hypothetical protein VJY37_05015 [Anaerovoracaceae bacterium]|nr:hypothetical protein [Anaerovoracaceae bacterium]
MHRKTNRTRLKQFKSKEAVVDNNVLVDLFEIGRLDLLFKVFKSVEIPQTVYEEEVTESVKSKIAQEQFLLSSVKTIEGYELLRTLLGHRSYKRLSTFDRIIIAIARQDKCLCSSNDGLLRKACVEYNIECTGTLGILGAAYENELITDSEFVKLVKLLYSDSTSCFLAQKTLNDFVDKHGYEMLIT